MEKNKAQQLAEFLKERGIQTLGVGLIPNHKYKRLGLNFSLPKTEEYLRKQIRLPCRPEHTNDEIEYVVKTIKDFFK